MVSELLCLCGLEQPLLPGSPGSIHRGHRRPGPVLRCLWVMEEAAFFFFLIFYTLISGKFTEACVSLIINFNVDSD